MGIPGRVCRWRSVEGHPRNSAICSGLYFGKALMRAVTKAEVATLSLYPRLRGRGTASAVEGADTATAQSAGRGNLIEKHAPMLSTPAGARHHGQVGEREGIDDAAPTP